VAGRRPEPGHPVSATEPAAAGPAMRPSQPLYDALAGDYEAHFAVAHRRAYDTLAWEAVRASLPERGPIVDAGCGTGRWAARLIELGYEVVGIEQAQQMLAELRRRRLGARLRILEGSMEEVELPAGAAGMVLAMGSLQYARDPEATIRRFAGWVRPGGMVAVLVDSLVGLVLELLHDGKDSEALERLRTRRGVFRQAGQAADLHLLDRARLERAFAAAGLVEVRVAGLLVGAVAAGRDRLAELLAADWHGRLAIERALAADPLLADAGKQLLAMGRRPGR
jgi:SAM-dependent methyltransferase